MKIAVLSDLHSNADALRKVIEDAKKWGAEKYYICGDIVGYGAEPDECITIIRELRADAVAGNHDWGVLERTSIEYFNGDAQSAILWTKNKIKSASRIYLDSLPLILKSNELCISHANFKKPDGWEYILTLSQAAGQWASLSSSLGIIGHSHQPFIVKYSKEDGKTDLVESKEAFWDGNTSLLINAGSVGQPRDGNPRACYLRVNTKEKSVRLIRVEYDIASAQSKIINAGLPESLGRRLSYGR
ncbi:metallophosphoesterase family protein [bacterium]|nr:metallophosphoesterase family protein [bacterium]